MANISVQQILVPTLRIIALFCGMALVAIAFVCTLVVLQGQRDEQQRVDVIVVLPYNQPDRAHLDYALELYRRGYAPRLLLTGTNVADMQANLVSRGVPEAALLTLPETDDEFVRMQDVADLLHAQGIHSTLLVNEPENMLLDLKMMRDLGLSAYGSPLPDDPVDAQRVFQASLNYWQYVLLGGT